MAHALSPAGRNLSGLSPMGYQCSPCCPAQGMRLAEQQEPHLSAIAAQLVVEAAPH